MPDETIRIVTSDIPGESPQIEPDVPLKSERGVDYTKLRDLLATRKWKEANRETEIKMREAAGGPYLDRFPCEDLRTIDQLWVKYSNGSFGFSVQKRIYESLWERRHPTDDEQEIEEIFGQGLGWVWWHPWYDVCTSRVEEGTPPEHLPDAEGHLPTYCRSGTDNSANVDCHRFHTLRKRLDTCRV
ncbi:GUN4 domain-containing protein [Microcoleus sp. Pol11C2]|uniref:GUN4 domain-containing protein n=1 Tax=Microcoleus sp. Pol11C2 TaxID=3055389 RepID=UPI002FD5FB81